MAYNEVTGRERDASAYTRIVKNINAVGLKRLRTYCTTKRNPVKDFDRDIEIIKCVLKNGPSSCVVPFGISKQRADKIMRKYERYALEINDGEVEE